MRRSLVVAWATLLAVLVAVPAAASEGSVRLEGAGFGHGVGMSQYGARSLATKGWSATRILQHYYPGATVETVPTPNLLIGLSTTPSVEFRNRSTSENSLTAQIGGQSLSVAPGQTLRVLHVSGTTCRASVGTSWREGPCTGARVIWNYDRSAPATHIDMPRTDLHDLTLARGFISFNQPSNLQLHTRLEIRTQEYLYGLAEMPSSWPAAALGAQATAGRTYAMANRSFKASCSCHLLTTTAHQYYVGWAKESEPRWGAEWVAAVNRSAVGSFESREGAVVTYNGSPISAFYSSSSGGATEDSADIWGGTVPYLKSQPDPYSVDADAGNPLSSWVRTPGYTAFAAALGFDSVFSMRVVQHNTSGTPHLYEVRGTKDGRDRTVHWAATDAGRATCGRISGAICSTTTVRTALGLPSHAVSSLQLVQPDIPEWFEGDFTGNGSTDVASYNPVTGDWVVGASTGSGYTFSAWGNFSPRSGWTTHLVGDFTGNGRDDIASYHEPTGRWWVSRSNGSSFTSSPWASLRTKTGWTEHLVGDFTGNGRADIASYHPSNGSWWVHASTSTSFNTRQWDAFRTRAGWQAHLVGDVDGDGRADIASYHPRTGVWWVSRSTGSSFSGARWATYSPTDGWDVHLIGDFTGNGRADVASYYPSNGTWWVGRSLAGRSSFSVTQWARFRTRTGWDQHLVGDFTGNGRADIASYHPSNGTWWVSASDGSRFSSTDRWATYRTKTGWHPHLVGDANGDGKDDLLTYHPSNRSYWVTRSSGDGFTTTRWGTVR
jgi:SpoIID/LytB domain protein